MSMPTNGGPAVPPPDGAPQPQLMVLAQYVKDFSFENPNAPASLNPGQQPQINVSINVNATPINGPDVEVELKLEGRAEIPGTLLFSFELTYAGVFRHPERAARIRFSR